MERKTVIILAIAGGAFAYIIIALIIVISFYNKSDSSQAGAFASVKKYLMEKTKAVEAENADNAQADEKPAQTEEIAGLSKEEAAAEDAELLRLLESKDGKLRELMVAFMAADCDNSLLRGEKEGIEKFIFDMPGAQSLSYANDNYPANIDWPLSSYRPWVLTEEQMEYMLSSICGKQMDCDFSVYDSWIDPYIGFGGHFGGPAWDELERFSVERVDADTWKVGADYIYYPGMGAPILVSNVCFTVIRNPESCFDGYSLTNFEENLLDKSWAKIYYDYLTKDPEGIDIATYYGDKNWGDDYRWNLIYVDDDMVPELYLEGAIVAGGDFLLHISRGQVVSDYFSNTGGSYVPYSGLIKNENGRYGIYYEVLYNLQNGALQEKGTHNWADDYAMADMPDIDSEESYNLDGKQVSEAQYNEFVRNSTGGAEFQSCLGEYSMGESCLDFLNYVIQWY